MRKFAWLLLILPLLLLVEPAYAQQGISAVTVTTNQDGSQDYTMTLQALFIMTALSLIPAFIMMMTSFTRIIVVLMGFQPEDFLLFHLFILVIMSINHHDRRVM